MLERFFPVLTTGPAAYAPRTPWNAWAAAGAAIGAFIVAMIAAYGATVVAGALGLSSGSRGPGAPRDFTHAVIWLLAAQTILIVLTIIASGAFGGDWRDVLALHPPRGSPRVYVEAMALLVLLVGAYNILLLLLAREALLGDLKVFIELAHSPARLVALPAIGIGAPLSEELLFRGFLLSALAASTIGFRHGALLTTAAWTSLHAGYSIFGLLEVFLVGLLFAWMLWRTGSLWVPLFCHAAYNSILMLALMLLPIKL